jgi:hypothetical protein
MADQLKVRPPKQVLHVALLASEEVVKADHIVPGIDQPVAQVRA